MGKIKNNLKQLTTFLLGQHKTFRKQTIALTSEEENNPPTPLCREDVLQGC